MIVIALFTRICLKDKFDLCLINCHIHSTTETFSACLQLLASSLPVVYEMTGIVCHDVSSTFSIHFHF